MKTLLIIDDDVALNNLLATYFEDDYHIVQAFDGEQGIAQFSTERPDLILLDVMMPKIDGVEVLKTLRQTSSVPILMLTAKAEDMDKILGLELGADDYVAKPCNPRELRARLKNLLGRQSELTTTEGITVDDMRRQVKINGDILALTDVEYDLFHVLYASMLTVVPKDTLFEQVFKRELQPFDRTLDVHISNLRKKIATSPIIIQTVRGKGYRLCPDEATS